MMGAIWILLVLLLLPVFLYMFHYTNEAYGRRHGPGYDNYRWRDRPGPWDEG